MQEPQEDTWLTVDDTGHVPGVAAELPQGHKVLLDAAGNIMAIVPIEDVPQEDAPALIPDAPETPVDVAVSKPEAPVTELDTSVQPDRQTSIQEDSPASEIPAQPE